MSTRAYVKQLLGVSSGAIASILYRDRIMDEGFIAEYDFVSDYCNGGSTAAASGRTFVNLLDGGAVATVDTAISGGIGARGLDFSGGGRLKLPQTFNFPSTETHFAVGFVLKAGTPGASRTTIIAGYGYQTGTDFQWGFTTVTDANSAYASFRFYADGSFTSQTANLGWLTDGNPHFVVGEFEVVSGTSYRRLYVDGVLVASNSTTFDGTLIQPANAAAIAIGPAVGLLNGFTNAITGQMGRIWAKRWEVGGADYTAADIAKLEYAAYGPAGAAAAMYGTNIPSRLRGSSDANRYAAT